MSSLGMYELWRGGCPTVVDFYRYPSACARAIGEASLIENAELIARWNGHDQGRIRCDWAPHAPDTCSDDLLREVKKLADAHGGNVHTHLSQLPLELEAGKARTAPTPPQLMRKLSLLHDQPLALHCILRDP